MWAALLQRKGEWNDNAVIPQGWLIETWIRMVRPSALKRRARKRKHPATEIHRQHLATFSFCILLGCLYLYNKSGEARINRNVQLSSVFQGVDVAESRCEKQLVMNFCCRGNLLDVPAWLNGSPEKCGSSSFHWGTQMEIFVVLSLWHIITARLKMVFIIVIRVKKLGAEQRSGEGQRSLCAGHLVDNLLCQSRRCLKTYKQQVWRLNECCSIANNNKLVATKHYGSVCALCVCVC